MCCPALYPERRVRGKGDVRHLGRPNITPGTVGGLVRVPSHPFASPPFRGIVLTTMRIIRRYSNRKLYDTQESHYVTLTQVAAIIRAGDEVRVLHKDTGNDLTTATMALIIFEEEKRGAKLGLAGLRKIIQTGQIP